MGTWRSGSFPLQAGGIDGFPGAPDELAGIGSAGNGGNLVTTYLFRNTFSLTAAEAAMTTWTATLLVDDGCVIYVNGIEVARLSMPDGAIATTTLASFFGDETNYVQRQVARPGAVTLAGNSDEELGGAEANEDSSIPGQE